MMDGESNIVSQRLLKHILVDSFEVYQEHYKNLPAQSQAKLIQLADGTDIFCEKETAQAWYNQN